MGQSSNDVIPSAIHVSGAEQLKGLLAFRRSRNCDRRSTRRRRNFGTIIKIGRTHLMDATPVRLGQEFSGYAQQIAYAKERARKGDRCSARTGARRNSRRDRIKSAHRVSRQSHPPSQTTDRASTFYEAKNHFEAQGGKDAVVEASGQLKTIAVSLFKIANDIRWLGSGPRCGIGEIQLPATQPGSSIMPGKVNPVMC